MREIAREREGGGVGGGGGGIISVWCLILILIAKFNVIIITSLVNHAD